MNEKEYPLVFFTVFSQFAVGLILMAVWMEFSLNDGPPLNHIGVIIFSLTLLTIAIGASLFHLGHPFESIRTLSHLHKSWLSREILIFGLFGGAIFCAGGLFFFSILLAPEMLILAALIGGAALYISGRVYSPPSYPALNNGLPILFFLVTTWVLGAGTLPIFLPSDFKATLYQILLSGLILGCILHLLIPSVWMAGGAIMKMTGVAYYRSSLYWVRMTVGFFLPIILIITLKKIPIWLPVLLLMGEMAGRILFFSHVIHRSYAIGRRSE